MSGFTANKSTTLDVVQVLKKFTENDPAWDGPWRIRMFSQGDQARLYAARRDNTSVEKAMADQVVIKLFKQCSAEDKIAFLSEKQGLVALSESLHPLHFGDWTMRSPTLFYTSENPLALVMSVVPGISVESWLQSSKTSASARRAVAEAILIALKSIWSRGMMYGDLNLKNILHDPTNRTISFIDPGLPTQAFRCDDVSMDWYPASRDLAYLLFSVAVSVKRNFNNPSARDRQLDFVKSLLREFVDSIDSKKQQALLLREICLCTKVHLDGIHFAWSPTGLWRGLVKHITRCSLDRTFAQMAIAGSEVKK